MSDKETKEVKPSEEESPKDTSNSDLIRHQEQRTFLRERFLRLLNNIWNVPVDITLSNKNTTKAQFGCADVDVLHFQVNNLETPLGALPSALLRSSDIISMSLTVDNPNISES